MSHIRMYKAIILIITLLFAGCTFLTGSMDITTGEDRMMIEMSHATGTARQYFKMNSDQDIRMSFIHLTGSTQISLFDPDDQLIYEGNGSTVNDFTVKTSKEGEYELIVEAVGTDGTILLIFLS